MANFYSKISEFVVLKDGMFYSLFCQFHNLIPDRAMYSIRAGTGTRRPHVGSPCETLMNSFRSADTMS